MCARLERSGPGWPRSPTVVLPPWTADLRSAPRALNEQSHRRRIEDPRSTGGSESLFSLNRGQPIDHHLRRLVGVALVSHHGEELLSVRRDFKSAKVLIEFKYDPRLGVR